MHIVKRSLVTLVALGLSAPLLAQTDRSNILKDALILAQPDLAQIQLEDSKKIGGAYRYGVKVPVDMARLDATSTAGGTWTSMKDGRLSWSRTIASPGALSLDFHFAQLQLPTGAELHIASRGEPGDGVDAETVRRFRAAVERIGASVRPDQMGPGGCGMRVLLPN